MKWISVKEKTPIPGEIVVVWLSKKKEPSCVRVEKDREGYLAYIDLVPVDIYMDREDIVTHWMPLPASPLERDGLLD